MTNFRYGPVELHLVGFEGERPDPRTLAALTDLLDSGLVRLLDFIILRKEEDGSTTVVEVEENEKGTGFDELEILSAGIVGEEDIQDFAEQIPSGSSAALIALELAFARTLAESLAAGGGVVLRSERVPAPIVNALLDLVEQEGE
ncbi:DUF6325 family protein [Microbacterium abyssi]|uniref:DUF6325 family protein n=1 Tax=Microbacterium abyssi TaxID=2782166 RepID=UPI001888984A|nr:DUF6325 family protein [Microbacterium sp. A18JL241]